MLETTVTRVKQQISFCCDTNDGYNLYVGHSLRGTLHEGFLLSSSEKRVGKVEKRVWKGDKRVEKSEKKKARSELKKREAS